MRIIDPTQDGPQAVLPSRTAGAPASPAVGMTVPVQPTAAQGPVRGPANVPEAPMRRPQPGMPVAGAGAQGPVRPPRRTPVMVRPPATGGAVVPNPGRPMSGPGSPGVGDGSGIMAANGVNAGELGPLWSDTFV